MYPNSFFKKIPLALCALLLMVNMVAAATNILIVGRSWENQLDGWATHLEGLGDVNVDIVETTPADPSGYDQIWYADFKNWNATGMASGTFQEPSDDAIQNILPGYLENGGNIAFLTDHNGSGQYDAPKKTHAQIKAFLDETTTSTDFQIHPTQVWWDSYKLNVINDPRLNLEQSLADKLASKTYNATACAGILPSKIGSGIGVLKVTQSWDPQKWFDNCCRFHDAALEHRWYQGICNDL